MGAGRDFASYSSTTPGSGGCPCKYHKLKAVWILVEGIYVDLSMEVLKGCAVIPWFRLFVSIIM